MRPTTPALAAATLLALATSVHAAPYVSPDGYQITPPDGWTTDTKEAADHHVYFDSPGAAEISVTAAQADAGVTLDGYLTQIAASVKRNLPDFKIVSKRAGTLAGEADVDAVAAYTLPGKKVPVRLREVILIHGGTLYTFSLTETQRDYAKTVPLFDTALQSVHWTKPTGAG